ncbi:MAG TPA: NADH-quinone oxidoreductase subunit M [Polyangiaceae bacterium]
MSVLDPFVTGFVRRLFALAIMAVAALVAWPAAAAPPGGQHPSGRVVLSLAGGEPGPLILHPVQGGLSGNVTITNVGADPLIVSRVSILGDDDDVRSPPGLLARFAEGAATSATIAPGAARDVVVTWTPDRDPKVRQAFGQLVVTSTDEQAGEVAMGFRGEVPTGLGWVGSHALSWLVLLPLVVPLLAVGSRLVGQRDGPLVRFALIGVTVAELFLSLWIYARFAPEVGRADGNDGFQFVERLVWVRSIGAEWYVGVDGISVTLLPLAAALAVVAVLVHEVDRRSDAHGSAFALLTAGIMGAFVGLDLVAVFAAWQLVLLATTVLVSGWGGGHADRAAAKVAIYGAIGSMAMLAAFVTLWASSGRAFLVDGTSAVHTLSIPELARTSFAARGLALGVPLVEIVWVLLIVAVASAAPVVPLHGWLVDTLEEAPAGAAIMVGGVVVAFGPYLLLRVGYGAVPEGTRWATSCISALGTLGVVYGALCAMAQNSFRGFVAFATVASSGACLFGAGSLTPQGIAAAVTGMFAHGLAVAMLVGFASALERRVHTSALARLGGLATETPSLAMVAGVGLAVSLGVPGAVGFWGALLSLLGGFVRHPVLALSTTAAFVALAAAHIRVARLCLAGRVHASWRQSHLLEPFGGRIPDATAGELAVLVPLAVIAVALGIWPSPVLTPVAVAARDISAVVDPVGPDPTVAGP